MKNKSNIKKIIKSKLEFNKEEAKRKSPPKKEEPKISKIVSQEYRDSVVKPYSKQEACFVAGNPTHIANVTRIENSELDFPYIKEDKIIDVVIVISSYNRFKMVNRLLNQIYSDECNYVFRVILLNDGSTDERYDIIPYEFSGLVYLKNQINGGKVKYWESITKLLQEVQNYRTHTVLQLDDDYILCDQFLNRLLDKFFEKKVESNKYVALSFHRTSEDVPKQWGLDHWVDGGTLYDYKFLKIIGFKIDPINESRWNSNGELSSGVWHQVSRKITGFGFSVFKTESSLALHDGNYDSKMNSYQRDRSHIITWNFLKNK